ncbi:hypothetical protein AAHC03_022641 [Spirometra sp. Aus1]
MDPTDRLLVTSGFEGGKTSTDAASDTAEAGGINKGIYAPVDYFVRGLDTFDLPAITAPPDALIYYMAAARKADAIANGHAMAGIVDPQMEFLAQLAELKGCADIGVFSGAYGGLFGGPFGATYDNPESGAFGALFDDLFGGVEGGAFGGAEGGAFGGAGGPFDAAFGGGEGGGIEGGALGVSGFLAALLGGVEGGAFDGAGGGAFGGAGGGAFGGAGFGAGALGGPFGGAEGGVLGVSDLLRALFGGAEGGGFDGAGGGAFGGAGGGARAGARAGARGGAGGGAGGGPYKDSITAVLMGVSGLVAAILGDQAHTKALMRTEYGKIIQEYVASGGNKTAAELVTLLDKMRREKVNQDVVLKKLVTEDRKQAAKGGVMNYQAPTRYKGARVLAARRKKRARKEREKKKLQRPQAAKHAFLKRGGGELERVKRAPAHRRVRKQKNRERVFDFFELPE